MCRFIAYTGPAMPLGHLVSAPEHSLIVQSYRPREMRSGVVNADGFGIGWYLPGDSNPALFTSASPIWADANLPDLGRAIRSGCMFAAVRSATPGMPFGVEHVQPFHHGPYLFLHNGYITRFRERLMRRLRQHLRDEAYLAVEGWSDSEHLFALWLEHLSQIGRGSGGMVEALQRTLAQVRTWARALALEALMTIAITDGASIIAVRDSTTDYAPSLYLTTAEPFFPEAVVLASEPPFANGAWRPLASGMITVIEPDRRVREVPAE